MKSDLASKKQYFYVKDSIFSQRVHVFLNYPSKEFVSWAKRQGWEFENEKDYETEGKFAGWSSHATDIKTGRTHWLILVGDFSWTISSQGTLIHEIVHTIINIWKSNNIPYNDDTQEFLAHSIGNLYEDIARKIFLPKKRPVNKKIAKKKKGVK